MRRLQLESELKRDLDAFGAEWVRSVLFCTTRPAAAPPPQPHTYSNLIIYNPCGDGREKEDAGDDRPHGLSLAMCPTCAAHKTYNDDRDSARSTWDTGDKYTILLRLC
ncbi:hypothetical protein BD779DRAFT_1480440 [Infundibulicybe gibba]|nr:hypothetical protein BD779DRAFT_1480440 [Infundibulicybe gibba]